MPIALAASPEGKPPADLESLIRSRLPELPPECDVSPELRSLREKLKDDRKREAERTERIVADQVERERQRIRERSARMSREELEREIGRHVLRSMDRQMRREIRRLMRGKAR